MVSPNIIIPKTTKEEIAARVAAENDFVPLRIKCPECQRIYPLFVKNLDEGLHVILGQACPYCKRFIKESDDPEKILVDLQEIRELMKDENKQKEK